MNLLLKSVLLAFGSYFIYAFILLPITLPTYEDFAEREAKDGLWRDDDVMWFVQVTDLHISKFQHLDIKDDLKEFYSTTLDIVKPSVVLASGDLTDAKDSDGVNSFQIKEEWRTYQRLLEENNVLNKTIYLDLRGNHDSFNVYDYNDKLNFFKTHSGQGPHHKSSFLAKFKHKGRTYSFIAIDATLNPGPKKVFNFFGFLNDDEINNLAALKKQASGSDHHIYFGHFPTSCVVSTGPNLKELMEGGMVYLSGHLHTLGGLAPKLYTIHRTGTPEYELGDWKENRRFRVLAVDNGILSFVDQKHTEWPIILVTNPKDSNFVAPQVEDFQNVLASTFIRVLVFSKNDIVSVKVKINKEDWVHCSEFKENVYTAAWDPFDYVGRPNVLFVEVTDDFGDKKVINQQFIVDASSLRTPDFSVKSRLLLMSDVTSVLQFIWISLFVLCILPTVIARYAPSRLEFFFSRNISTRLKHFSKNSFIYNLYSAIGIYVTFGPWHIGEILSGHVGFIFPWGTVVRSTLLPSFYPYIFAIVHLFFFHIPLLWSLIYKLDLRLDEESEKKLSLAISNIPVTLVLSAQACLLLILFFFPSKLGIFKEIAILLAPLEIFTIFMGFILNAVVSYHIKEYRRLNRKN